MSVIRILVLHGPNLNLLGQREPGLYGRQTLEDIGRMLSDHARDRGASLDSVQSNSEGDLVTRIGEARGLYDGLLFNPAAYTHTSVALCDALLAAELPCVEVHLTQIASRESFRRRSLTAPACIAQVCGFGAYSYVLALDGLLNHLHNKKKA